QTWFVAWPEPGVSLLDGGAVSHHGVADLVSDTQPGGACAEYHHLLVPHRDAGGLLRRVQASHHHCAGALHVIVEHAVIGAVVIQDGARVLWSEVLEMQ